MKYLKTFEEVYYDSRKEVEGYVDANDLVGQRLWFHTNRTHRNNGWNGMIGIYDTTPSGIKEGYAGRYTNDNNWKYFNSDDSSMNRVAFITNINYNFGKDAPPNS